MGSVKHVNSQIAREWTPSPPVVINLALSWLVHLQLLTYRRIPLSSMPGVQMPSGVDGCDKKFKRKLTVNKQQGEKRQQKQSLSVEPETSSQ
ncbi:hypothetical protein PAMP_011646 [Pampus punctatissimus]